MYPNNGYNPEVDRIDRKMQDLQYQREELIRNGNKKPMEPQVESLVLLAHEAGEMKALYRSTLERADRAEKDLKDYRGQDYHVQLVEMRQERDSWKTRAIAAEEKLAKKRKRR